MSIKDKRQTSFSKAISWRFTVPISSVSYFCSTGDFFPKVANVAYVCAVHMAQHLCIIRFLFGCTELKSTLSLSLQLQAMAHQISCRISQILSHSPKIVPAISSTKLCVCAEIWVSSFCQILAWDAFQKKEFRNSIIPIQKIQRKIFGKLWNSWMSWVPCFYWMFAGKTLKMSCLLGWDSKVSSFIGKMAVPLGWYPW